MTEDQLEQETLAWLTNVGKKSACGVVINVNGDAPERINDIQIALVERLRQARGRLNHLAPPIFLSDTLFRSLTSNQLRPSNIEIILAKAAA